jgi:hypothetical protein
MQSEMTKHKEASLELNSLRAEVHSLSRILSRKERDNEEASCRSARAGSDITQLQSVVSCLFRLSLFFLFIKVFCLAIAGICPPMII